MIKITKMLAEDLIEWLEVDLENAYDEDDRQMCQALIDDLNKAMEDR